MKSLLIAVCMLLITLPAAAADKLDPYLIDKKVFKKQIKTIALAPFDVPEILEMPDGIEQMIEQELIKRLEKKRFEVIPSSVYQEIRNTMEKQVGGYNTDAGRTDNTRVRAVREHSFREMLFRHEMDAIVLMRIGVVKAAFENDRATWHGTTQKVEHTGGGWFQGTITSSSVQLFFLDRAENLLFENSGGIEVLMQRKGSQIVRLPAESYFQDEKRILKAAQTAVKPL